jgi:hypothetical protein
VNLPADAINRRPSIKFALLAAPERLQQFLNALDWAIAEIQAYGREAVAASAARNEVN